MTIDKKKEGNQMILKEDSVSSLEPARLWAQTARFQ